MNNNCQVDHGNVPGCASPPDAKLIAEGSERRFVADAKRARDALEMYEELGHEVRIESIALEELNEECHGCLIILKQLKAVYTRTKQKDEKAILACARGFGGFRDWRRDAGEMARRPAIIFLQINGGN